MPEKSREQWIRAMRRWLVVGAVVGAVSGVVIWATADGAGHLLAALAFYVPMGAALVLMLWMSTYRYEFAKVWGWRLTGLSVLALLGLIATGVGVGCLQGVCGER